MPQGDKYIGFTNYLKNQHNIGKNRFTLTFEEIEQIWGFPLSSSMKTYFWANDRTQSYALGWLYADYVVDGCDLRGEYITFAYNPEKVAMLFSGVMNNSPKHLQKSIINKKSASVDVPKPCEKEVEKYLMEWDNLENYRLQEAALNKLFYYVYPKNDNIEDILIKHLR